MSTSTPEDAAFALFQAGRFAEAENAWREILARRPGDAEAQHMVGLALVRGGRLDEGLAFLARSLEAAPRNAGFLNNRAVILGELGRLEEAERDVRRALQSEPRSAVVLVHLGSLLRRQQRLEEALATFRRAAALDARLPDAQVGLGNVLRDRGDPAGAQEAYRAALAIDPGHVDALYNRGILLLATGDFSGAEASLGAALERSPGHPLAAAALTNWGNALKDRGDLEGAATLYDRAFAADPQAAEALNNRGNVALELGDFAAARRDYKHAARLRPDYPDPRFSLAQLALFERDFAAGWDGYELRFETTPPMAIRRAPPLPALAGEMLGQGLRVAVWSEQGVGDQILFSTLLPELVGAGVHAVVEIDPRLLGLYARCVPGVEFAATGSADPAFATCAAQVALGSIPRLLRRDAAGFERQPQPLLAADPARVAAARERLGPGRWIAVSWRSFQARERQYLERRKSMPVELLARLAEVPGVRLLDLQYGDASEDRARFASQCPGLLAEDEGLDRFNDFEGLAAVLAACEALVTVSNATAHLAGALGKRTLLLYPGAKAPFHYWVPGAGGRAPWYPSVEIVTATGGDWAPVVDRAARLLGAPGTTDRGD